MNLSSKDTINLIREVTSSGIMPESKVLFIGLLLEGGAMSVRGAMTDLGLGGQVDDAMIGLKVAGMARMVQGKIVINQKVLDESRSDPDTPSPPVNQKRRRGRPRKNA